MEALGGCGEFTVKCPVCGVATEVLHAIHDNGDDGSAETPQWAKEGLRGLR